MSVLVIFSTFPDGDTARKIADELVTEKLAACANLLPPMQSIYRWKGAVERAEEVLVIFKTTSTQYPTFEAKLKSLHPYDVPEIIAMPVTAGSMAYLSWVADSCIH